MFQTLPGDCWSLLLTEVHATGANETLVGISVGFRNRISHPPLGPEVLAGPRTTYTQGGLGPGLYSEGHVIRIDPPRDPLVVTTHSFPFCPSGRLPSGVRSVVSPVALRSNPLALYVARGTTSGTNRWCGGRVSFPTKPLQLKGHNGRAGRTRLLRRRQPVSGTDLGFTRLLFVGGRTSPLTSSRVRPRPWVVPHAPTLPPRHVR